MSSPFPCADCGGEVQWHKLGDEPDAPVRVINLATGGVHDCNPMATAIREQTSTMQQVAESLTALYRDTIADRERPRISRPSIERQQEQRAPSPARTVRRTKFRPAQTTEG